MATSRVNGFQRSIRDMYPDYTAVLGTVELTVPEIDELDHLGSGAVANVETADGVVRPVKTKSDLMQMGILLAVGIGLLFLLSKT